jgi:hypothetical protein
MACVLLITLFLQSCDNSSTPFISTKEKSTNNPQESINRTANKKLADKNLMAESAMQDEEQKSSTQLLPSTTQPRPKQIRNTGSKVGMKKSTKKKDGDHKGKEKGEKNTDKKEPTRRKSSKEEGKIKYKKEQPQFSVKGHVQAHRQDAEFNRQQEEFLTTVEKLKRSPDNKALQQLKETQLANLRNHPLHKQNISTTNTGGGKKIKKKPRQHLVHKGEKRIKAKKKMKKGRKKKYKI